MEGRVSDPECATEDSNNSPRLLGERPKGARRMTGNPAPEKKQEVEAFITSTSGKNKLV